MRRVVRKSIVRIVGHIWLPPVLCAQDREMSSYDVDNARDKDGKITRESVKEWLSKNSGDFQSIVDFEASIEDGDETIDIPWAKEENEIVYADCMYPPED